jgi:2-polyprenyl-6-methoxyphenol hydroxylase-like FAD-dependent oxidoreductase
MGADPKVIPQGIQKRVDMVCEQARVHPDMKVDVIKWFSFPIVLERSTRSSGKVGDQPVYLVGDSLENPHFFSGSGINIGVQTASDLADLLARYRGDIPERVYAEVVERHRSEMISVCRSIVNDLIIEQEKALNLS